MTAVVKPIDVKKEVIEADESSNSSVGIPSLVPTGVMHAQPQSILPMTSTMFAAQQQNSAQALAAASSATAVGHGYVSLMNWLF